MSQSRPSSSHADKPLAGPFIKVKMPHNTPGVKKSPSTTEDETHNDIQLVKWAMKKTGRDKYSAEILKNVYNLLCRGGLQCYKKLSGSKEEKEKGVETGGVWKPWDLPFASALCHGSRVLIQFPEELNGEILSWLFCREKGNKNNYDRSAATHAITVLNPAKKKKGSVELNADGKILTERKIYSLTAAAHAAGTYLAKVASWFDPKGRNYGVNIALGGAGNINPFSEQVIHCNGEHGHLYLHYRPGENGIPGGLLVGIEQSAPRKKDQNGGSHGVRATHHKLSATHGKNFAEKDGFAGPGGPDRYHDGIFLNLTVEKFREIQGKPFSLDMLESYTETASTLLESKQDLPQQLESLAMEQSPLSPSPLAQPNPNPTHPLVLEVVDSDSALMVESKATSNEREDEDEEQELPLQGVPTVPALLPLSSPEPRSQLRPPVLSPLSPLTEEEPQLRSAPSGSPAPAPVLRRVSSEPVLLSSRSVSPVPVEEEQKLPVSQQFQLPPFPNYSHVEPEEDELGEESELELELELEPAPAYERNVLLASGASDSRFGLGDVGSPASPSPKTQVWKIVLATIGVLCGIAAVLTGAGALVGVSVLAGAGIAVWMAASIIAAGGVTTLSSTAYICRKVSCPGKDEQPIDSMNRNQASVRSLSLGLPSTVGLRSPPSPASAGLFSACCLGKREKERPRPDNSVVYSRVVIL